MKCIASLMLLIVMSIPVGARAACPVFVLEREGAQVTLHREMLSEGEVAVYLRDARSGTVDLVLPVGPGRSANFVRLSDADRIVVRFVGGELHAQVRRAEGATVELPVRKLEDLRGETIRVSVTVGDSLRRSFVIANYDTSWVDEVGPAGNMFAGRLPATLARDGVVVQTDTWKSAPARPACGSAAFERDRWLFARARRSDGRDGWFVVDLGASESVVAREFVPAGQPVESLSTTEHSASGVRRLPYAPAGATGAVLGIVGSTTFDTLAFGNLRFPRAGVTVLDRMPDVFGRPVVGILGMDLLRGCDHLRLEFAADGRTGTLALSTSPAAGKVVAETPFSWVDSHLLVRGRIEGRDARWILDSGSPGMVVDSAGAPPLRAATAGARGGDLRGLDGNRLNAAPAVATSFALGKLELRDAPCRVAPLSIFESLREPGVALGVVGVAELARTRAIEVDFGRRVVRWLR